MAKEKTKWVIAEPYQQGRDWESWRFLVISGRRLEPKTLTIIIPSLDGASSTGQVKCISLILFFFAKWLKWGKGEKKELFSTLMIFVFIYISFYLFFCKKSSGSHLLRPEARFQDL